MSEVNILPQGALLNEDIKIKDNYIEPSKTYKIDFDSGKVVGFCDKLDALKQSIYLILNTERFEYLIYSSNYGSELKGLIGKDRDIAESEYKRRIREALIQDDRVSNVDNFIFEYNKDSMLVKFTVFSFYGDFDIEKEVM
ncbi:DUF2634 domain-containing protein [Clostridium fallax]|uniref:Phage protein XkdS n=1 Tax=Clostridium fallax TaxID=1533 RepID=A0A1M4V0D9_9CLOT|nr:DUF2634 domain-containing protein [Clostridium fallax]SHE62434.1 Protein of unknown function [Clostridium fallax]SQB06608.1 phage-like element PBSX protein xkdS [Clostridium fallax]